MFFCTLLTRMRFAHFCPMLPMTLNANVGCQGTAGEKISIRCDRLGVPAGYTGDTCTDCNYQGRKYHVVDAHLYLSSSMCFVHCPLAHSYCVSMMYRVLTMIMIVVACLAFHRLQRRIRFRFKLTRPEQWPRARARKQSLDNPQYPTCLQRNRLIRH